MTNLYFTIGLPRSGKSTYCTEVMKNSGLTVVCADNIRHQLYGQPMYVGGEEIVHAVKHLMIRSLLHRGNTVIVDGTHTRAEHIEQLLKIGYGAQGIFFPTDPETCKKRAIDTQQEYLLPVIDRMVDNLKNLPQNLKDKFQVRAKWL